MVNARDVLDSFPLYFLGETGEDFYLSFMSHLRNPTSTTNVGYLEGQAGFRWESLEKHSIYSLYKNFSFNPKLW